MCTDIANHEFIDATTEKVKLQVKTLHAGMPTEEYLQSSLVYGDIDFNSFGNILIRMKPLKGDIFVDLGNYSSFPFLFTRLIIFDTGSGTGRAVVYAHLLFGDTLKCSRGIEILPLLHQYAVDAVAGLPSKMLQHEALFAHHSAQYSVELGDFLAHDCFEWQTADLVFVNSTCFSDQMMASIQARALGLKKGSRVATLTRFFQSDAFVVTDTLNFTMSWGIATCFFHLRL